MKKIALFITAIAVSLSIGGKALADTATATLADKASITPDNTILYFLDKAIDNLRINLAFGDEKKAEVLADVAEERLGDSEIMAGKGKTDLANQTLNDYNDKMTEAENKIEDAIDKLSSDATSSTTSSSISSPTDITAKLDELKKLETEIINKQIYSIEVLKNIENKVSQNEKDTIAQVIEMQTRKKESIAAVAKERQTLLEDKKSVTEAEKSLEKAKKAGNEQAIKTAEDTLKQAEQTLTTENEKFCQVVAAKKEAMKGGVGQLKKLAKKDLKGQTADTISSTNNAAGSPTTATGTTPAANTYANTTNTPTQSTANNNTAVTTSTNTNITVKANDDQDNENDNEDNFKENKDHNKKEHKENKENKGHENKSENQNESNN